MRGWRWRRVLITAATFGTLIAVLLGAAYAFQRKLIYHPSDGPVPPASELVAGGRDVTLRTSDGLELRAWYFPVDDSSATVLAASGNAGNRALRLPLARALTQRGISVLLLEYRGYGGNPGKPTEGGLARDVRAARDFLLQQAAVEADELLYYGASLGAAVVTELATEFPPAGMVLRSPFTRLSAVARHHYPFLPVRSLLKEDYPVAERVREIDVPVTVVYGSADSVVPPQQSRTVARAAAARLVEVAGAEHNGPALSDGARLIDAIAATIPE